PAKAAKPGSGPKSEARGPVPPRPTIVSPPPLAPASSPAARAQPTPQPTPAGRQPLSKLRLTVAKQMTAAKREVPHFYVTTEIDMTEAARLRSDLAANSSIPERITFTHLIVRALALVLPQHPRVNASWSDESVTFHDVVNIAVAVAVEDGLVAPVVRG